MANIWINETEIDEELQIVHKDMTEPPLVRNKLRNFKGFQKKSRRNTGAVWVEERREKHKEKLDRYGGKGKGMKLFK